MSFSYSGNPANSQLDQVRFLIGDTSSTGTLLQDEEITWSLTEENDPYNAAAAICQALATRFARESDKYVGDLRLANSQKAIAYRRQSKELRILAMRHAGSPHPYAGGISLADKKKDQENTDVPERFALGMDDFPGSGSEVNEGP